MWLHRRLLRVLAGIAFLSGVTVNCGSGGHTTAPATASLAGTYRLQSFIEAGQDLSQASSGTAVLTDTTYHVNIAFANNVTQAIADSGIYKAYANGTFTETSFVTGAQSSGTYSFANGVWTVSVTSQGIAIKQVWQKQ